jgi:hypothetical protein
LSSISKFYFNRIEIYYSNNNSAAVQIEKNKRIVQLRCLPANKKKIDLKLMGIPSVITGWHSTENLKDFIYRLLVSMSALTSSVTMVGITTPWGFLLLLSAIMCKKKDNRNQTTDTTNSLKQ